MPTSVYLPHVDGLRALAVLSVLIYHIHPALMPGGFSGVDVFFVISGFVVSLSMASAPAARLKDFLLLFYARRMRRILPALLVCLTLTSLISALLIPPSWLSDSIPETGWMAYFGLSNWALVKNRQDYFSVSSEFNPFTHTWSLGVEEQFYLVFPVLFYAWHRGGRWRLAMVIAWIGLGLASLLWSGWHRQMDPSAAFYLLPDRFWQLILGALLLVGWQRIRPGFRSAGARAGSGMGVLAWLGVVLLVWGAWGSRPADFPFPGSLPSVIGAVLLIGGLNLARDDHFLKNWLSSTPMVALGLRSYSLYLWHWPVVVWMKWSVGLDTWPQWLIAALASIGLAMASYRWIERPFRSSHGRPKSSARDLLLGLAAIAVLAMVSSWFYAKQYTISWSSVVRQASDWYPHGPSQREPVSGCQVGEEHLALAVGEQLSLHRHSCPSEVDTPVRIFVVGDSHAMGYMPLFKSLVRDNGLVVNLLSNAGCPFVSLRPSQERAITCKQSSQAVRAHLDAQLRAGDVLFLPSLRLPRMADQWAVFSMPEVQAALSGSIAVAEREQAILEGMALLRPWADRGVRIIFEAPKPIFRTPAFRCAEDYQQSNSICQYGGRMARDDLLAFRLPVMQGLERFERELDHVSVWDPFPILCPPDRVQCSVSEQGRPLFFDADHLSAHGNRVLLPDFKRMLRP